MNIKYLEYINLYGGEIFVTDKGEIVFNIFKAIELCNNYFIIVRQFSDNHMPNYKGTIEDSLNYLSRFAKIRKIELSKDKFTIDFESFTLDTPDGCIECIYDYSFIFDTIDIVPFKDEKYSVSIYDGLINYNSKQSYLKSEYKELFNIQACYTVSIYEYNTNTNLLIPSYKILKRED